MSSDGEMELSKELANVVESLACRVAEQRGGRITPNHLIPYLPMSLGLVKVALDGMVDGSSVLSEQSDNITEYVFTAYHDKPPQPGELKIDSCISCGKDLPRSGKDFCPACSQTLKAELDKLADKSGWPAQAVYEHEILYLAANHDPPIHAEDLASRSRYTLGSVRKKLDRMGLDGFVRQELDWEAGLITYHFSEIDYPKERYRRNMAVVRAYPASMTEEVELRLVRIIIVLAVMVLGMFALAFLHVPLPFLILVFLVAAPITSILIWRHRARLEED